VLHVRGSVSVLGAVVLGAGTIAVIEPVLPLHLVQQNGTDPLGIGLLFALLVGTGAAINPLVGALVGRADARLLVGVGAVTSALALLGIAAGRQSWQIAVAMAVLGGSNAFLLAPATTLISHQGMNARPPALGGAYAAFNLAYAAGLMIGPLLAGTGTDLVGFTTAITMVAALVAVLGLFGAIRLPTGLLR
jgi:MFS family permease